MATLQVRDLDDRLYRYLKTAAKLQNRSLSQEVITILENYVNSTQQNLKNSTLEFLSMTGAWKDDKTADELLNELRDRRNQTTRFGAQNGFFD